MSSTHGTIRDTVRDTVKDAKDAARESGKAASESSATIQSDLEALRGDLRRLTEQIADIITSRGSAALDRARSNIEGVMADATGKRQDAMNAVREVGDNLLDAIDHSLEKRPYTTLALAAGIGFLLGAMRRR